MSSFSSTVEKDNNYPIGDIIEIQKFTNKTKQWWDKNKAGTQVGYKLMWDIVNDLDLSKRQINTVGDLATVFFGPFTDGIVSGGTPTVNEDFVRKNGLLLCGATDYVSNNKQKTVGYDRFKAGIERVFSDQKNQKDPELLNKLADFLFLRDKIKDQESLRRVRAFIEDFKYNSAALQALFEHVLYSKFSVSNVSTKANLVNLRKKYNNTTNTTNNMSAINKQNFQIDPNISPKDLFDNLNDQATLIKKPILPALYVHLKAQYDRIKGLLMSPTDKITFLKKEFQIFKNDLLNQPQDIQNRFKGEGSMMILEELENTNTVKDDAFIESCIKDLAARYTMLDALQGKINAEELIMPKKTLITSRSSSYRSLLSGEEIIQEMQQRLLLEKDETILPNEDIKLEILQNGNLRIRLTQDNDRIYNYPADDVFKGILLPIFDKTKEIYNQTTCATRKEALDIIMDKYDPNNFIQEHTQDDNLNFRQELVTFARAKIIDDLSDSLLKDYQKVVDNCKDLTKLNKVLDKLRSINQAITDNTTIFQDNSIRFTPGKLDHIKAMFKGTGISPESSRLDQILKNGNAEQIYGFMKDLMRAVHIKIEKIKEIQKSLSSSMAEYQIDFDENLEPLEIQQKKVTEGNEDEEETQKWNSGDSESESQSDGEAKVNSTRKKKQTSLESFFKNNRTRFTSNLPVFNDRDNKNKTVNRKSLTQLSPNPLSQLQKENRSNSLTSLDNLSLTSRNSQDPDAESIKSNNSTTSLGKKN